MIPSAIETWYRGRASYFHAVQDRVSEVLRQYARDEGYVFEDRIKSLESLAQKLESGRFRSWNEVDDIYACTVAVPLSKDEDNVRAFIRDVFRVILERPRGSAKKSPDAFRFDSTRMVCKLQAPPGSDSDAEPLFGISFEVQVKSLFELAWSKTTHALTYKSDMVDWRRYRLSAHLKAATEQLDLLLAGFETAAEYVPDGSWPSVDDQARIRHAFAEFVEADIIPSEFIPKDWSQFAGNLYRALQAFEGRRPSGFGSDPLRKLDEALTLLKAHFEGTPHSSFPRSLSLFQYTVAILSSAEGFNGKRDDYYLPLTDELDTLFPDTQFPSNRFNLDVA